MAPFFASLSRRQLFRLGLGAGAAAGLPGLLAACQSAARAELCVPAHFLPAPWLKALPRDWSVRQRDRPADVLAARSAVPVPALVGLTDGWAGEASGAWQPFGAETVLARLATWAGPASRLFAPVDTPAVAFPWAYSPLVILLRSRPDLQARSAEGWSLLLDRSLKGRLVLPSSPRVCMALMGGDFGRIQRLRDQALAHDGANGLNLVLSRAADAAVLPLRALVPLLRRDQRLSVILPSSGAPLSWQLLLRPRGTSQSPPDQWLESRLSEPLLTSLLAAGWVPPLPPAALEPALQRFPRPIASLLSPEPAVLERCWSLPPLTGAERLGLQSLWDAAAPQVQAE